jgi:glucose-6-phosphate 1-dehydrogenase
MSESAAQETDVLVVFGITGDLARKMTFSALYLLEARGRLDCPIIGVAKDDWSTSTLIDHARQSLEEGDTHLEAKVFDRLAARLSYLQGDFDDEATYTELAKQLEGRANPLFYLEIPPFLFAPVIESLNKVGLTTGARVVVEKPFGHDRASAAKLNEELHALLDESQIFRIDHFLGKEPAMDLQYLRFANDLLEPVWNRDHVAAVQITMAENFGVEDRGSFYDAVGCMRDVVQNHLLQVLALVAMEPAVGADADALRDKKVEVFRSIPEIDPAHCVRGQYRGYTDVRGVAKDSATETYIALRLEVDSWRWAGVPFFIRAGKALEDRVTEVRLIFKRAPRMAFLGRPAHAEPNQIVLRIDPDPGLSILLVSKGKDERASETVHLDLAFASEHHRPIAPYERLLGAAMDGDHRLFTREDAIDETWRIVQPLLDNPPPIHLYDRGSDGPAAAKEIVRGHPPWHEPWLERSHVDTRG